MARNVNPRTAVALVVVTTLVSITFAAAAFHEDDPAAEKVRGGVILSVTRDGEVLYHHVSGPVEWHNTRLSLHDGTNEIEWIPPPEGWEQGLWTAFSFEPMEFGDLEIRLTIVDLSGDGYANLGDLLILEPVNGTAFELATEYTMEVYYPRIVYATDMGSVTTAVMFSLTDDGVLDSDSSTTVYSPWGGGHTLGFQMMTVVAVYLTTFIVVPMTLYYALVDKMVRRARMRRIHTENSE